MPTLLKQKIQYKRPVPRDPHGFESIGDIMRRMRGQLEDIMTAEFDPVLSRRIDALLDEEQRVEESRGPAC